jgi:hypothetical protein
MLDRIGGALRALRSAGAAPLALLVATAAPLALLVAGPAAALPTAPGFIVSHVDVASGDAIGDVVTAGGSLFVAVGPIGADSARLVRIDGAGTPGQTETVIVEGLSAPSGMDYDALNGRLAILDNGFGTFGYGGSTGDNAYLVDDPLGSPVDPPDATALRILMDDDVPGAADILFDPTDPNHLFITDASEAFPPAGRLLEAWIDTGTFAVVQTGLGFAAGLASDGTALWIGDLDGLSFTGLVHEASLAAPGSPLSTLVAGLAGQYDLELSADGTLLASSGGEILRIDPSDGSASVVASGFGFAAGLWEDENGVIYALDGFASGAGEPADRIWVLTPIPEPDSGLLLGAGLLWLARRRRRG